MIHIISNCEDLSSALSAVENGGSHTIEMMRCCFVGKSFWDAVDLLKDSDILIKIPTFCGSDCKREMITSIRPVDGEWAIIEEEV